MAPSISRLLAPLHRPRGDKGNKVNKRNIADSTESSARNSEGLQSLSQDLPVSHEQETTTTIDMGAKDSQPQMAESAAQETSRESSSKAAQALVVSSVLHDTAAQGSEIGRNHKAKEPQPMTQSVAPALSTSQRLWNEAYESIEKDEATAKLTKAYMRILTTVLMPDEASYTAPSESGDLLVEPKDTSDREKFITQLAKAYVTKILTTVFKTEKAYDTAAFRAKDLSTRLNELKDPTKRQEYMKVLVEGGQAKISATTALKIVNGVGAVAQFLVSAMDPISVAVGNLPQAALPWAGVCIGLQVSTCFLFDNLV
jgi:hypothetical protein